MPHGLVYVTRYLTESSVSYFYTCASNFGNNNGPTWNDKTRVFFDDLVSNANGGFIPDDFEFILYERDSRDNIIEKCYRGV